MYLEDEVRMVGRSKTGYLLEMDTKLHGLETMLHDCETTPPSSAIGLVIARICFEFVKTKLKSFFIGQSGWNSSKFDLICL